MKRTPENETVFTTRNPVLYDPVKLCLLACAILLLWSAAALADINRTIGQGYTMVNMSTPAAWSRLKNVQYNPVTAAILGGLALCEGNMSIVHSDRGDHELLLFTFTSSVTGYSVTYVVSDVRSLANALKKANASNSASKPGPVSNQGVDMADGSRSVYVLRLLENGGFAMDFERAGVGIMYIPSERDIAGLIALAER